jgi:hypothetical protein
LVEIGNRKSEVRNRKVGSRNSENSGFRFLISDFSRERGPQSFGGASLPSHRAGPLIRTCAG